MSSPILDFSHLTPDERIELAEQLWDSLPVSEQQPTEPVLDELRRRRAALEADGDPGEPWDLRTPSVTGNAPEQRRSRGAAVRREGARVLREVA
jgi:putative addiction module component (TIGR02574 family)